MKLPNAATLLALSDCCMLPNYGVFSFTKFRSSSARLFAFDAPPSALAWSRTAFTESTNSAKGVEEVRRRLPASGIVKDFVGLPQQPAVWKAFLTSRHVCMDVGVGIGVGWVPLAGAAAPENLQLKPDKEMTPLVQVKE